MPKKNAEKATMTSAAPNAPPPMPAFLADLPTSALASSTSARISVETSVIALCTSVPTVGSTVSAVRTAGDPLDALDTLWATGSSSFGSRGTDTAPLLRESCRITRRGARPGLVRYWIGHPSRARAEPARRGGKGGASSVLGRRRGQLLLD